CCSDGIMTISYHLIIELLSRKLTVQTLDEFIASANSNEFNASLTIAEMIEDYEYLSVMSNEDNKWKDYVAVYAPHIADYPNLYEKNVPITLSQFAKLLFDYGNYFKIEDFYGVVEKECEAQDLQPDSLYLQFDIYYGKIVSNERLRTGNVGRN